MSYFFGGRKRGKLTLSRQPNACGEETGDGTQLTRFEEQTSLLQPQSTSATVTDGSQSASQNITNFKLSTGSVDSGVAGNSKNSSLSKLLGDTNGSNTELATPAAQFSPAHDHTGSQNVQPAWTETMGLQTDPEVESDGCYPNNHLLQIRQSLCELSTSLGNVVKVVEELSHRVANLELQMNQLVQREVLNSRTPSGSSIAFLESTPNQLSSSSAAQESPIQEGETEPGQMTFLSLPGTSESQFPRSTPEQRKRHFSDSKMARCRQSEIRKKLGSVVPKSLSEQRGTILEDNLLDTEDPEVQVDHAYRDQAEPRKRVEDISILETRLISNVKHSLPKFIQRTNWKLIVPHLVSVDLSDHATTDFLLNETRTDHDKGIHFYLRVLPCKGPDAYTRFYTCLCDEKEHLGHKSLLQILDK